MNHIFQDTINQITVCLRFAMKFLSPVVLISIGKLHELMMADFKDNFGFINFNGNGWMFEWQKDAIKPDQWHHLCYNFVDNMIQVVIDGISYKHEDMKNLPDLNLNLFKLELSLGHLFDKEFTKRYVGLLTEVNIWKRGMNLENMIEVTSNCFDASTIYEDKIFLWSSMTVKENTSCLEVFNTSRKSICNKEATKDLLLIETAADFEHAVITCNALGGELFFPRNDFELQKLTNLKDTSNICRSIIIGGKKSRIDNEIIDLHGHPVNMSRWGLNKPNGRHFQQCIETHNLYTENYIFDDISCDLESCYSCFIPTRISFQIRGLLPRSLDSEFLAILDGNTLNTRGNFRSEMTWKKSFWCLENEFCTPGIRQIPPFGLRSWANKETKMEIKLTQASNFKIKFLFLSFFHILKFLRLFPIIN